MALERYNEQTVFLVAELHVEEYVRNTFDRVI